MKRIAHISDLHFGAQDERLAEILLADLAASKLDLIAVSGDITQRARTHEFRAARAWLDRLPAPVLAVPGNHDVPLFDLRARLFRPLELFRRWISPETDPVLVLDDLLVIGVNTARSSTISGGRISTAQIERLDDALTRHGHGRFVVVVTHHPFLPRTAGGRIVGRGARALAVLEKGRADLLLAGHHHLIWAGDLRDHHVKLASSILVAHAGTALSHRLRGEPNSWNLVSIAHRHVAVQVRELHGERFEPRRIARFVKHRGVWHSQSTSERSRAYGEAPAMTRSSFSTS